ncbi:MAG: isoprenyl transferase [Firmicutes bacterium]|nr:isoprenyl transferase [Bacillota bacterium]
MSKKLESITIPKHIAIILDGNGRWAKKRHMPRTFGHRKGVENIKTIALEANNLGIKALTVYAFSTENWNRPEDEVNYLMTLPSEFEKQFSGDFEKYDIRVIFSGRRTKLSNENLVIMRRMETDTLNRSGLILNICFDYGSYDEITEAVKEISKEVLDGKISYQDIVPDMITKRLSTKELPPLDLLIRPSGEQRLSNFLLWQASYAELYFCDVYWPAFSKKDLEKAIMEFNRRERRFGEIKG